VNNVHSRGAALPELSVAEPGCPKTGSAAANRFAVSGELSG